MGQRDECNKGTIGKDGCWVKGNSQILFISKRTIESIALTFLEWKTIEGKFRKYLRNDKRVQVKSLNVHF
jgi:hypothetical protein